MYWRSQVRGDVKSPRKGIRAHLSATAPIDPKTRTQDLPHSCGLGFTGADCGYNYFWIDRGQSVAEVNGQRRSWLIVEPMNGRIPLLPKRQKLLTERYMMMRTNFDGPEARPLAERSLLAFGSRSTIASRWTIRPRSLSRGPRNIPSTPPTSRFMNTRHEGNYALPGILAGAREDEKKQPPATTAASGK